MTQLKELYWQLSGLRSHPEVHMATHSKEESSPTYPYDRGGEALPWSDREADGLVKMGGVGLGEHHVAWV